MFENNENCKAEWCFKIRTSVEGKEYNDKDDEFHCKENKNQIYNLLKG